LGDNPNRRYRQKKKLVAKAEADGDWDSYISLHERPYRVGALNWAAEKGLSNNPPKFWGLVGKVWQDSENIRQNRRLWKRMWCRPIKDRRACMSLENSLVFESLPDKVEAWRGTNYWNNISGLSWTLDQEKAVFFANRFADPQPPLVAKALIAKRDIVAYFGERNEREIVSLRVSIILVRDINHVPFDYPQPSR
jgi:hypothetical protein